MENDEKIQLDSGDESDEKSKLESDEESDLESDDESDNESKVEYKKQLDFAICPDLGPHCRCPMSNIEGNFNRRHINPLTPWKTLNARNKKKMKKYCNNPLHDKMSKAKIGIYHFRPSSRPTWFYDCKVPSNSVIDNLKILEICKKVGIKCFCTPGHKLCYTCNDVVFYKILQSGRRLLSLEPLVRLLPLFDAFKMSKV